MSSNSRQVRQRPFVLHRQRLSFFRCLLPLWLSVFIWCLSGLHAQSDGVSIRLYGIVRDADNGEALPQAAIWLPALQSGAVTDVDGRFDFRIPAGTYAIEVRFLGYATRYDTLRLNRDRQLTFDLKSTARQLSGVEIKSRQSQQLRNNSIGVEHLSMMAVKKLPSLLGEADLLKSVQLLPGIVMASEGSSGFSVRGGSPDQNFILLDRVPIYNPSHALGFFSVFNNDVMEGATVYKGDIPVQFGGRLSAVIDATMHEGDYHRYHITGGVGLLLARLTVEGPIVNDLFSFLVSGRRTYFDAFLPLFDMDGIQLYFYDANAKLSFRSRNRKDKLTLSGYLGRDVFGMKGMNAATNYGNKALCLSWHHFFSDDLVMTVSGTATDYRYMMGMETGQFAVDWAAHLTDYGGKADFLYTTANHEIRFGLASTYHIYDPGDISVNLLEGMSFLDTTIDWNYRQERFHTLENALYIGDELTIGRHFMLKYGLRLSTFSNIGADSVFYYRDGMQSEARYFPQGRFYHTYWGLEPRIGFSYLIDSTMSLKLNYTRTMQYTQMAQNSTSGNPLDVWFPANPTLLPQIADQGALSFEKHFKDGEWETSIEFYYRYLQNVVDFKDHAEVLGNRYLYGEVRTGTGQAYGMEVSLKRTRGIVNGSVSYTLSKSTRRIRDVNRGETYPSPYDRPHALTVLLNIEPHPRHSVNINWVFYSGLPTTYPHGKAVIDGEWVPIYGDRNSDRLPDYHRLDIGYTFRAKPKPNRRFTWDLSVGCYNVYARKNPWMINFKQDPDNPGHSYTEMIYLFSAVPSVTFNFRW